MVIAIGPVSGITVNEARSKEPRQSVIDRHRTRRATGAALAALLLALAGCQGDDRTARFENYLTRLGRTLDVPVTTPAGERLAPAPRSPDLKLPIASGSLDTLDFLAISGCAVQVTIGKRNSSLGRLASDSQRLLLELEFLALAPECIDYQRSRGSEEIADTLESAWRLKRRQLPALIFNATLGADEYREFWRIADAGPAYPGTAGSQVITALEAIDASARRWLAGDYSADNEAFELALSRVATGDGGRLLAAMAQQDSWLAAADRAVASRLARGPLCAPGYRADAVPVLDNVIARFFIGELQPRAAALGSRFHTLLPPLQSLESRLASVFPENYGAWQRQRDAQLQRFAGAPRRHVEQLKALRAPCEAG
jgi:hypothetical protein